MYDHMYVTTKNNLCVYGRFRRFEQQIGKEVMVMKIVGYVHLPNSRDGAKGIQTYQFPESVYGSGFSRMTTGWDMVAKQ